MTVYRTEAQIRAVDTLNKHRTECGDCSSLCLSSVDEKGRFFAQYRFNYRAGCGWGQYWVQRMVMEEADSLFTPAPFYCLFLRPLIRKFDSFRIENRWQSKGSILLSLTFNKCVYVCLLIFTVAISFDNQGISGRYMIGAVVVSRTQKQSCGIMLPSSVIIRTHSHKHIQAVYRTE